MPTLITHTFIAVSGGKILVRDKLPIFFWISLIICSVIPDADVIGFRFGIPYGAFFGHRGFFHSLFFAGIMAIIFTFIFIRFYKSDFLKWWQCLMVCFLIGASHGLLDALTNGGLGIALFSPFDNHRYFFPWTPIKVSPIGVTSFFRYGGMTVIINEILWVWLPIINIILFGKLVRFFVARQNAVNKKR